MDCSRVFVCYPLVSCVTLWLACHLATPMSKPLRTLLAVFLVTSGGAPLFAQAPKPEPAIEQAPIVLKSTTRLVQVNVIVQNKQGEPAEGLKKEDFTILDQGKEQKVATFSANSVAQRDSFPASILPRMYSPTESAKRDELREA